jgi:hypothetical protein
MRRLYHIGRFSDRFNYNEQEQGRPVLKADWRAREPIR